MVEKKIKQTFDLTKKSVCMMEKELIKKYGENYKDRPISSFFSHIALEKIKLISLINLSKIKSWYYQDCEIAIYMIMGYLKAEITMLEERTSNFYDSVIDDTWNKELLRFFPYEYSSSGVGNSSKDWCRVFQEIFLCAENYEIFDVDKVCKDITRYGAFKSRELFDIIKSAEVENRIIFDFKLGISLTNCIYTRIGWIKKLKTLEKTDGIIKLIAQMPCIYIRNEIALEVFDIIGRCGFKDEVIEEIEKELKNIVPAVEEFFWFLVKVKWSDIIKNGENINDFLSEEKKNLCEWMDTYEKAKISDGLILECKGKVVTDGLMTFEKMEKLRCLYKNNYSMFKEYSLENQKTMKEQIECIEKQNKLFLKEKDEIKNPGRELNRKNIYAVIHKKVMREILYNFY